MNTNDCFFFSHTSAKNVMSLEPTLKRATERQNKNFKKFCVFIFQQIKRFLKQIHAMSSHRLLSESTLKISVMDHIYVPF